MIRIDNGMLYFQTAAQAREEGLHALSAARKLDSEHVQKTQRIQADLNTLRQKEKQIAQVKPFIQSGLSKTDIAVYLLVVFLCFRPIKCLWIVRLIYYGASEYASNNYRFLSPP